MIYYALAKGRGDGCGYTMGCNLNWTRIEADDDAAAMVKALVEFPPGLDDRGRSEIESIVLLCVDREIDMGGALAVALAAEEERRRAHPPASGLLDVPIIHTTYIRTTSRDERGELRHNVDMGEVVQYYDHPNGTYPPKVLNK